MAIKSMGIQNNSNQVQSAEHRSLVSARFHCRQSKHIRSSFQASTWRYRHEFQAKIDVFGRPKMYRGGATCNKRIRGLELCQTLRNISKLDRWIMAETIREGAKSEALEFPWLAIETLHFVVQWELGPRITRKESDYCRGGATYNNRGPE